MNRAETAPHPVRDLTRDWRDGDAARLTLMENQAREVWPGGGGRETEEGEMERWIRHSDLLGAFTTEDGDRIVSLCTLNCRPGQRENTYIPHLVCHPEYHGRGFGRAVLRAAVDRACDLGFGKVDLNTWSGNTKAVPLYKKMGFMWQPETMVFMESFVPVARRHPLAAAFFAAHDWYDTLQRSLALEEDLTWRGPVRVYEYRWQAPDGSFLRLVFDRQSWRVVEVETADLLAGCTLPGEKLVTGKPHPVRWQVTNRRTEPVRVVLTARGDPGVSVACRRSFDLTGTTEIEAEVTLDPELPEKTRPPTAACLTTDLLFGDTPLELCAGAEPRPAVEVSLEPVRCVLPFTRPAAVRLTLTSNLDEPAEVEVAVRPRHNAVVHRTEHHLTLTARGSAELEVEVTPDEPGAFSLEAQAWARTSTGRLATRRQRLDLVTLHPGGAGTTIGERIAILYSGGLLVIASRRSGHVSLHHLPSGLRAHRLHLGPPQIGPPFSWDDLFQDPAECWSEETAQGPVLHLRTPSVLHPGVVFERTLSVDRAGILCLADRLLNGSGRTLALERLQMFTMSNPGGHRLRLFAPRPDGVYGDPPAGGGRTLEGHLPPEGSTWPEGWLCRQGSDGLVSGLLWGEANLVDAGQWGSVRQGGQRLEPGQSAALPVLGALVGDGTWQTVRRWWRLRFGPGPAEEETPAAPVRDPIDLEVRPEPLLLIGDRGTADLCLRTPGTAALDGALALEAPVGVRARLTRTRVRGLTVDRPFVARLQVTRETGSSQAEDSSLWRPSRLDLRLETEVAVYRHRLRLVPLSVQAAPVAVERDGDLYRLDNGLLAAKVAPAFSGCVVSLCHQGREFLNCSYPEAGRRGWRNPWHGGLQPQYNRLWGRLDRERFKGRVVHRRGIQGLRWQGVRLECTVAQESARGHCLFVEYLLAPGVPLLAVVLGRRDRIGAWTEGEVSVNLWPRFAEAPGTAVFRTAEVDQVQARLGPHRSAGLLWRWGGLTGSDGCSLFLGGSSDGVTAGGWGEGPEGGVLFANLAAPLPVHGQVSGLAFVAPALTPEQAEALGIWAEFTALP
ncbi:MAG: GNAT family N-acetyltransferase [Candidatus Latescibacterota bacterium]|jgi:ribosomal protein S18 acetylase RimI-like enzyme